MKRAVSLITAIILAVAGMNFTIVLADGEAGRYTNEGDYTALRNVMLLDTASIYYSGGGIQKSLHSERAGAEPCVEFFQNNKAVNHSNQGGFSFAQFQLSDEQLGAKIASAKFSCYVSGATNSSSAPGGKYKINETVFASEDNLDKYASSYIEDTKSGGFTHLGSQAATGKTVTLYDAVYKEFSIDITAQIKSMQTDGIKDFTMAVTSSSTLEKMLSYESGYGPAITLTFASEADAVRNITVQYKNGSEIVKSETIELADIYEGDTYSYISNNYIYGDDGVIYAVGNDYTENKENVYLNNASSPVNGVLKQTVPSISADSVITYEVKASPNAVFYSEFEELLGTSAYGAPNGRYMASGGKLTKPAETQAFYDIPEDGCYQVLAAGTPLNGGTGIFTSPEAANSASAYNDEAFVSFEKANNEYYGIYSAATGILHRGDKLTLRKTTDALDYVVVRKIEADDISAEILGADGLSILPGGYSAEYTFTPDIQGNPVWSISGVSGVAVDENTGIVTVSENASEGVAILTAAIGSGTVSVSKSKKIKIEKVKINDFELRGTTALNLGETQSYSVKNAVDNFGNNITGYISVSYISSDNKIISAVNNELTANKKGTADITVTAAAGEAVKAKTMTVHSEVYYIVRDVNSPSITLDVTEFSESEHITGYRVTTADANGKIVQDYEAQPQADLITVEREEDGQLRTVSVKTVTAADSIPVIDNHTTYLWNSIKDMRPVTAPGSILIDTSRAARVEVSPVYTYEFTAGNCENDIILSDDFAVSDYDIELTRADHIRRDIYVNGYMVRNDFGDNGAGRRKTDADLIYTAHDVLVDTGSILINKNTYKNEEYYKENADLSKAVIKKSPSIVKRNKKVYVIGDSLVAEYSGTLTDPLYGNNRTGWGQVLGHYFKGDIDTYNLAQSGDWASRLLVTAFPGIMKMAHEGDYIIIESGWNDVRQSTKDEMYASVVEMVVQCEAKGVHPVLVSPNASYNTWSVKANVQYASVMREAAAAMQAQYDDVIFVDLAQLSYNYLNTLYNGDKQKVMNNFNLPITGGDALHSSYLAAMKFAEIVAQGMADNGVGFINKDFTWSCTDGEGNVITTKVQ